jgi:Flp pilus assembly protein TadD
MSDHQEQLEYLASNLAQEMRKTLQRFSEEWVEETKDRIDLNMERLEKRLRKLETQSAHHTRPLQESSEEEARHSNDYGVQLYYRRQFDQAVQMLEDATRINPNCLEAWNNLAMVYSAMGQTERSIQAFNHALEIDPNRVEVLNNKGVLALLDKDPEKALAIFEEAKQTDPHQVVVLLNLAQAYEAQGYPSKAVAAWKLVLAIDPNQEEAQQHMRQYYQ